MIDDRSLQRALAAARLYAGAIDGDIGPETARAMAGLVAGKVSQATAGWPLGRVRIAAEQIILQGLGFYPGGSDIDGLVGPNTRDAWERWQNAQREEIVPPKVAAIAAAAVLPEPERNTWPTQAKVASVFGQVGKNQVTITPPYPMVLAWDKSVPVRKISLHAVVAPSALRVLNRALEQLGETKIRDLGLHLFGGSLNVRKMRGGSAYSMHSWGIAIDFDPERNQLRWGRDQARLGKPDAAPWWQIWEAEGWVSLGRARNYDWMHVQAARL